MFALLALLPVALMTASVATAPAVILAAPVVLTTGAPVVAVVTAPVALASYAADAVPAEAETN
jgi:hypothetical protein